MNLNRNARVLLVLASLALAGCDASPASDAPLDTPTDAQPDLDLGTDGRDDPEMPGEGSTGGGDETFGPSTGEETEPDFGDLASAPDSMADTAGAYPYFSPASILNSDEVWAVDEYYECTGDCDPQEYKLDLSVRRWVNGKWTSCFNGADCSTNEASRTWGLPIYSPADGEVVACFRNFPDNVSPPEKHPDVGGDDETSRITDNGNHVWIRTDEGDMIALTHMRRGSIPASVCPHPLFKNGTPFDRIDETKPKVGNNQKYKADAFVEPADRMRVYRGQKIGEAGNSGNSSGSHLHLQYNELIGVDEPGATKAVTLEQAYAQPFDAKTPILDDQWRPLDGDTITYSGAGNTMISPSPLLRRTDYTAGTVKEMDTVFLREGLAVTAIRNGQNNLQLTSWDVEVLDIDRLENRVESSATQIKLARASSSSFLVALRTTTGKLKLILYRVEANGAFTRLADYQAGSVSNVDLTRYGSSGMRFATAVRDADGDLMTIAWEVTFQNGQWVILRKGTATAGAVNAVAIAKAENFNGVAVAVRTASGRLKAIPYRISSSGFSLTREQDYDSSATVSSEIDITALPHGFAIASKDGSNRLRLDTVQATWRGDLLQNNSQTAFAGTISKVDIDSTPAAGNDVITTVVDSDGELLMIPWGMTSTGADIRRGGANAAGPVSDISVAPTSRTTGGGNPRDMLLTGVRTQDGDLKLIYWDVNLDG